MTSDKGDRRGMDFARQVQEEYKRAEREQLEADAIAAKKREAVRALSDANLRAQRPLPLGNICPRCWFRHGRQHSMIAHKHPDPSKFDLWKCAVCEYEAEEKTGLP
jgi:hypothetical protein